MKSLLGRILTPALMLIGICATSVSALAQQGWKAPDAQQDNTPMSKLQGIGIDQKLNTQLPLDLVFNDEDGKPVKLGDLFENRPVVLSLVYYECPMLCTVVLNDMLRGFVGLPTMAIGKDYDVITVSFNPNETPKLAAEKKARYVHEYGSKRGDAAHKWHFLTGGEQSIRKLTDAVGFRYKWDEQTKQYIHPSGITVLTPSGKISRYFFGIDFEPTDLRLTLVEASEGKIGSITDHIMLYCLHYDAATGKYGFAIVTALRVAGAMTVLGMAVGLTVMLRRDRNHVIIAPTATGPLNDDEMNQLRIDNK